MGSVALDYFLPRTSDATILVFDVTGRLVLLNSLEEEQVGIHQMYLGDLQPGVYFGRMIAGGSTVSIRFLVIERVEIIHIRFMRMSIAEGRP